MIGTRSAPVPLTAVGAAPADVVLPAGRYLSLSGMVTATTGGQTRALLLRNRLMARHCGVAPTIVTFDPRPHYPRTRELLRAQGQLVAPVELRNIFEDHGALTADGRLPDGAATGGTLGDLPGLERREDRDDDGRVYRRRWVHASSHEEAVHDHLRPDGTVFLRLPVGPEGWTPVEEVSLVGHDGTVLRTWPDQRAWRLAWLRSLVAPDERVFVISDSRFALTPLLPLDDPRFHVLHLMHNVHVGGQRHWSSPEATRGYEGLLSAVRHLDALVTLTHRQREDVAQRYGATTNLHVVPNPVESPPPPQPLPVRHRARFAVVARMSPQKNLVEAVRVFARVVAAQPDAVLDVYGDGPGRPELEAEVAALGLGGSVVLHGHDPDARDRLWEATAFLMTSRFEGYPLATLESLARGCPVVAYDVKYGPREQITDGVDGWVVPAGDRQAMADRLVTLARDPALVDRMSHAARQTAARHDHAAFLRDWKAVLDDVVAARGRRTALGTVRLDVRRLGHRRTGAVPRPLERLPLVGRLLRTRAGARGGRRGGRLELRARLHVEGHSPAAALDDAVVTLDAVDRRTGAVVPLPLDVRRTATGFALATLADVEQVFAAAGDATSLRLRLRLVWENSAWETEVRRPRRMTPGYEVGYAPDGTLAVTRGPAPPA